MRQLRIGIALFSAGAALAALVAFMRPLAASASALPGASDRTRLEQAVDFTRIQTITLLTAPDELAAELTTFWENTWIDLDLPFGLPLPGDYTTLTVSGAAFQIITDTEAEPNVFGEVFTLSVALSPTGSAPVYMSYFTDSRAAREGNQFRIFIRASSQLTSTYKTSVLFDSSFYEFISYQDNVTDTLPLGPPDQAADRVWWGPITVKGGPNEVSDKFDKYVALSDKRLPIDLAFQSYGVVVAPDRRSVQVTTTIVNSGTVETGNLFFIELYDRPHNYGAPTGPDDHFGGACAHTATCPISELRRPNYAYYPYYPSDPPLMPGQTRTITFTYTFHTGGERDLYLQVDSFGFGSVFGLVYEGGAENNNIAFLQTVPAIGVTYLPIVVKNR